MSRLRHADGVARMSAGSAATISALSVAVGGREATAALATRSATRRTTTARTPKECPRFAENGEVEIGVHLTTVASQGEADVICALLRANGIVCGERAAGAAAA